MTPSCFDLQVNGYAGVDFNSDDLTAGELHRACERLEADGVDGFLATIITEHVDVMCSRLQTLARLRSADPLVARLMAGVHIEGPFINETDGYRGAHPADAVRPAEAEVAKRLLDAACGLTRLFTLAPERDAALHVTRLLVSQGIVVSAGHCNPTLPQLAAAIDAGVTMFTHLGNGCPLQLDRHDNIVQRALSFRNRLWMCFIADGVHVPFVALGNYLGLVGAERAIVVTDGTAASGSGPGRYRLGRLNVLVGEDEVARSPGFFQLVGSAVTMQRSREHLLAGLHCSPSMVAALTSQNPRRAIGLGNG
jgi:N-acetylglucosamine-6-phosphate deacetylase